MVQVQAATFGGGISIGELVIIGALLYFAMLVTNLFIFPPADVGFFEIITDYTWGYPVCKSAFCLLPSQESTGTILSTFSGTYQNANGFEHSINLILSFFDVIKGVIGIFVVVIGTWYMIMGLYKWYGYWGVFDNG